MDFQLEKNVSLAQYTTLQLGGKADLFATVRSDEELGQALRFAKQTAAPVFMLGGGSNVLFPDSGFTGMIIKNEIKGIDYREKNATEVFLDCGSGEDLGKVIANTIKHKYWGLENLTSIPGTVGATPVQNVGAYGVEVSSLISSVEAINVSSLETKVFTNEDCEFSYRDSFFKSTEGRNWIITKVTFSLSKVPRPIIDYADLNFLKENPDFDQATISEAVSVIRSQKFPDWKKVGTAGSFFKNPIITKEHFETLQEKYPDIKGFENESEVKVSLGWVLDKVCNLKGHCNDAGTVCLFKKQALVLINNGTSSQGVVSFVEEIAKQVKEKTDIDISSEVQII